MPRYDLVVIGAGPAGFAGAMRARNLRKRVALVERDRPGGAGLRRGALSSKTLWELAKDYTTARRTDRGYDGGALTVDWSRVREVVGTAVAEREAQLHHRIGCEPPDGLAWIRGTARFTAPDRVLVTHDDGSESTLEADHFLIATGSRPRSAPGVEPDGVRILTSDHVEELDDFPPRLVILGAGVVGCEYATIFARFGRTEVHLLDRAARILPFEDEDVSASVDASLRELGVVIHQGARLAGVTRREDGVDCHLESGTTIAASHLLLSVGRAPAVDDLGLELAGVERTETGAIRVHGTTTTAAHIHAAGDTTADVALANVAEVEARHAVEQMFGLDPRPLCYEALSSVLFLAPEVATVGYNEQQAKAAGIEYRVAVVQNTLVPRNIAMRSTGGFVKLLARPDGRLLGLRVVGPQASATAQGVALLIDRGGTLEDLDRCFHPHPAIPEGVQECARRLLGRSILLAEDAV